MNYPSVMFLKFRRILHPPLVVDWREDLYIFALFFASIAGSQDSESPLQLCKSVGRIKIMPVIEVLSVFINCAVN